MISFACGQCGNSIAVEDKHAGRRAKCKQCGYLFVVPKGKPVQAPSFRRRGGTSGPMQHSWATLRSMPRNQKLLLALGLGIPALFLISVLVYLFGIRDTWGTDNYEAIMELCHYAEMTMEQSDDEEIGNACEELLGFIGNRKIENEYLAKRVVAVREAYRPVHNRLERTRRDTEARELVQRQEREARERAARQAGAQSDRSSFYNPNRNPPYLANEISGHRTRSGAIAALASQFERSTGWVERNMGSSNGLVGIHKSLNCALLRGVRAGRVRHDIVNTLREAWRKDRMKHRSRELQIKAMHLMCAVLETDVPDKDDREATLDYIQSTIDSW